MRHIKKENATGKTPCVTLKLTVAAKLNRDGKYFYRLRNAAIRRYAEARTTEEEREAAAKEA